MQLRATLVFFLFGAQAAKKSRRGLPGNNLEELGHQAEKVGKGWRSGNCSKTGEQRQQDDQPITLRMFGRV